MIILSCRYTSACQEFSTAFLANRMYYHSRSPLKQLYVYVAMSVNVTQFLSTAIFMLTLKEANPGYYHPSLPLNGLYHESCHCGVLQRVLYKTKELRQASNYCHFPRVGTWPLIHHKAWDICVLKWIPKRQNRCQIKTKSKYHFLEMQIIFLE